MTTGSGTVTGPLLAVAAALTTWATMLSWSGFSENSSRYLLPLLLTGVLVALVGFGLRRARLSGGWVFLGQVLAGAGFVSLSLTGSPVPVGDRWNRLVEGIEGAVRSAQANPAPVPAAAESLHPLLLWLGLCCFLMVDLTACTWRRVPLSGLVLLTIYPIPVSMLEAGVPWWVFALAAAGFLTMMFLHEDEQVSRWGRALGQGTAESDPAAFGVRTGLVRRSALGIGAAATALAVLLPALIPTLQLGWIAGGIGAGGGDVRIENPTADLRRNLQRGEDTPLVRVTTDDPEPTYLRISLLTVFTNDEWRAGDREIPSDQRANGQLPPLFGVSDAVTRTSHEYDVTAADEFESTWLPTMPQTSRIEAEGDWRYDRATMDFLAAGDETTANLSWSMTGEQLDLRAEQMAAAPTAAGDVETYTTLPENFPRAVSDLAIEVTAGQPSAYQRAVALQDWFRKEGGFEYNLDTAPGNGSDALLDFLIEDREGYCEQFAAAMAVMARSLNIPARFAIGFLRPDKVGVDTWEYSSHDMHAWPELYFSGSGWVRFEPTPGVRAGATPGYTRQQVPAQPSGAASSSAGAVPSEELPSRGESASADVTAEDAASGETGVAALPWGWILGGVLGVLAVVVVTLTPRTVRRARRERRWTTRPDPETAWAELRDTMTDLGRPWPVGLSPRATAEHVAGGFGPPPATGGPERPAHGPGVAPDATEALHRLVSALERHRYARPGSPAVEAAELRADTETCTEALAGGVSPRTRRRAAWLPRSVFRRRPRTSAVEAMRFDTVDHVG
jgi:transglutaminase-like putative cysteine protease